MRSDDGRAADAGALFDYLVDTPEPVVIDEIRAALGWTYRRTEQAIHDVRMALGADDSINLIAEPDGRGPWRYWLTGSAEDARWWQANRLVVLITQVRTNLAVAESIRRGIDGRTVEGRKARVLARTLGYIVDILDALGGDPSAA